MRYSIDTSGILEPWHRIYPPTTFPLLWYEHLPGLIESGDLRGSMEVKGELKRKDDDAAEWARSQADFFVEIDEDVQLCVREIMAKYPKLVKLGGGGWSGTDPFVIALARVHGAAVISEEKPKSIANPRIPDVCDALGVRCLKVVDLIREQGWKFH